MMRPLGGPPCTHLAQPALVPAVCETAIPGILCSDELCQSLGFAQLRDESWLHAIAFAYLICVTSETE